MATLEQIEMLMSEVGPVLDPLTIDAIADLKSWAIAMEEDLAVFVQFNEEKNCLFVASELGAPPAGDRTALYELLLLLNFHWNTTGGSRMAINGPGGEVVQVFEIAADGLDATRLARVLSSFAVAARAWREIVQRPASAHGATLDTQAHIGIRV